MGKTKQSKTFPGTSMLKIEASLHVARLPQVDTRELDIFIVRDNNVESVVFKNESQSSDPNAPFGVQSGATTKMTTEHLASVLSDLEQIETVEKIDGRLFYLARLAKPIFLQRFNADLNNYVIKVVTREESEVVIFTDKDRRPGTKGHNRKNPGFEVEFDTKDLSVRRANFVR